MPRLPLTNIAGLNLYVNPLTNAEGSLIRSVNLDSSQYGVKSKRKGYATYLGTADGSAVNSLFNWTQADGSTMFNYRASGSSLYYSAQGTGAWTLCGNGTITAGAKVRAAVLDNTLIICDGAGSTRHTTNGTSFTNTTLAPIATDLFQYQNRIYALGTASDAFYSTTNDATNWNTSGTSDSNSLRIPGAGKLLRGFKANDRAVFTKNSGLVYRWDGYTLIDLSTKIGPASADAIDSSEDFWMWINQLGHFGYGGGRPQILSNAVQKLFYNNSGSAAAGTAIQNSVGVVHQYDYFATMGSVTDDFTNETVSNVVLKYDYQKNEYAEYSLAKNPTAFLSYKDPSRNLQMIFGDSTGQCYTFNSGMSDNGVPITSIMEFFSDCDAPELEKKFEFLDLFMNPNCQAHVQVAVGNSFSKDSKVWVDLVPDQVTGRNYAAGHLIYRLPQGSRGEFIFIKITDAITTTPFVFFGAVLTYDFVKR